MIEKYSGDKEIKRHAKTGEHGIGIQLFEGSSNVRYYYKDDADSFG